MLSTFLSLRPLLRMGLQSLTVLSVGNTGPHVHLQPHPRAPLGRWFDGSWTWWDRSPAFFALCLVHSLSMVSAAVRTRVAMLLLHGHSPLRLPSTRDSCVAPTSWLL